MPWVSAHGVCLPRVGMCLPAGVGAFCQCVCVCVCAPGGCVYARGIEIQMDVYMIVI